MVLDLVFHDLRSMADLTEVAVDALHHCGPAMAEFLADGERRHGRSVVECLESGLWITRKIVDIAGEYCDGKVVSSLEGGYDLEALSSSVSAHLSELVGR